MASLATLSEIKNHWTLHDLMEAHDVLDYKEAREQEIHEQSQRSMRK